MISETTRSGNSGSVNWLRRAAAWVTDHELWLLLLIVPLLLIPQIVLPSYGLVPAVVLIAITWCARCLTCGWLAPPNPLNAPVLVILLLTVIGYQIAVDHYFLNRLWLPDTVLRVVTFFAMANSLRTRQAIIKATSVLLLLFTGLALLMFLVTNWDIVRLADAPFIYDHLPRFLGDLSGLLTVGDVPEGAIMIGAAITGINPRLTGNLLGALLPLAAGLFLFARGWRLRLPAALFLISGSMVSILSQTSTGLLGFLVGVVFVAIWWRPRLTTLVILFLAIGVGWLACEKWAVVMVRMLDIEDLFGIGVLLRLDMWNRALAMIGDMPFSGIGLTTFNLIQSFFYTGLIIGPEYTAHQLFLQTALDSGLPGLLALLWLTVALALSVIGAYRKVDDHNLRVLLSGIAASFLSFIVGGLAGLLTAPLIWIVWLPTGLAAATFVLAERQAGARQGSRAWQVITDWRMVLPFAAAILLALLLFPTARMRNWGLIQAHQAIYSAIETGDLPLEQAEQATVLLTNSLDREPDRAQLYSTRASLYAWQGDQEAALADLEQRVDLDLRDPYGTYAPFLVWQAQLNGEPVSDNVKSLQHVYDQWSTRFEKRAEFHVLMAIVMEQANDDGMQAAQRLEYGLEQGAEPRALLEAYLQRLDDGGLPAS